ncbi:MAG: hypothetical protein L6R38_004397 [Xanthoria sp. 2 TBL-2021]|nr:MAG: hypothetical protein L6R38_004397 [Xanthoria sp. 2 TBL-2021]
MDEVRNRLATLLGIVGPRGLPARDAAILLAQAQWDATTALRQFINNTRPQLQQEVRRVRNPPSEDHIPDPKDDGDDGQPIPAGVDIIDIEHPTQLHRRAKAVYHHQIRQYLIERDQRRYGNYRYKRKKGEKFEDQTATHPKQLRWGFDKREKQRHFPAILFRYKRAGCEDPDDALGFMRWRGHWVVDIDRYPLTDFTHIPSTLASNVEGGLLEAIERLDNRVKHQDLSARLFSPKIRERPTPGQLKARDNKLSQAMRRFREKNGMVTWKSPPGGGDAYQKWVDENLPAHLKAQNTTLGFGPLTPFQLEVIRGSSIGQYSSRSKSGDPAKRAKYLAEHKLRLERLRKSDIREPKKFDIKKLKKFDFKGLKTDLAEPISDSGSETETDHDGPDSRYDNPRNAAEEAALHDAMLPTILQFLDITGDLPLIAHWQASYMIILHEIDRQLRGWAKRQGVPLVELVGYGFWTGGIMSVHSAKLEATPLVTKLAEIEQEEEQKKRQRAATQGELEEEDEEDDDVEMGEDDEAEEDEEGAMDEGETDDEDEAEHSAQSDV